MNDTNGDTTIEDAKELLDADDLEGFILVTSHGARYQEVYNTPRTEITEAMQEHPYVLLLAYALAQFDALEGQDLDIETTVSAMLHAAQEYYDVQVDYQFEHDD